MNMGNRNKTLADQKQFVVKSNDLIRKTRYSMTTQQQKIVLFAVSKIRPNDPPGTTYTFTVEEISKACGLKYDDGGYYYKSVKEDIQELTRRIWVKMPDGREKTVSWIGDAEIEPYNGTITVKFHPAMEPFLFELRSDYTQYRLENVLAFKGKYTIRLYELLRSYMSQASIDAGREREVSFKLEELRSILDVQIYPKWCEFDRCVLRKAVKEINEYCDEIHVAYETYKTGRNISTVNFIISVPRLLDTITARQRKRERL